MKGPTMPAHYGTHQFARYVGISRWQMRLGREHGLLPDPDLDGERWSSGLAEECRDRGERLVAAFGEEPPIGSTRAAARLAVRVRLDVERRDVEVLAARGDLTVISSFRGHPVYLLRDLDALDAEAVRQVVAARKGPLLDSVDAGGAAMILDWPRKTFDRTADERGLERDRLGRFELRDVQALAADDELTRRILAEKRDLALARSRRAEARIEEAARAWLARCDSYLDRGVDEPPDTAVLRRALRALRSVRVDTDAFPDP
ncbi:hypothetical protein BJF79_16930 [Actinomadura sp. CNU-125]|uniref:hypothetical protein n=1 Tax=Actinomadura sp. CNU-125 TaxID=1904961 RepID=UPI000959D64A|nr:hypothetical protein [Actinomadura sp. CNU-125]OLT19251.1 hypothetical protein BJF79_16930 [Actinomadura sp. CNU-125]